MTTTTACARCKIDYETGDEPENRYDGDSLICPNCRRFYPPSLLKASEDFFDYALRLSSGEIICFRTAKIHGDYVTLYVDDPICDYQCFSDKNPDLPFGFARGIDVRLSEIVWCADTPQGS
jgi:hypothetical protein